MSFDYCNNEHTLSVDHEGCGTTGCLQSTYQRSMASLELELDGKGRGGWGIVIPQSTQSGYYRIMAPQKDVHG